MKAPEPVYSIPLPKFILVKILYLRWILLRSKESILRFRENNVHLEAGSKLYVIEKLMTHGKQEATSNMMVELLGEGSSAQIVSRSVAKGESRQVFHPRAVGKNRCHAHVQCDSIIMDHAEVSSIPEINAKHVDAAIIHEAAIGRINDEQLIKLRTLGMTEEEAEGVIIENFLN